MFQPAEAIVVFEAGNGETEGAQIHIWSGMKSVPDL